MKVSCGKAAQGLSCQVSIISSRRASGSWDKELRTRWQGRPLIEKSRSVPLPSRYTMGRFRVALPEMVRDISNYLRP